MKARGKWGVFLQPSLKWSLGAVEKCVETQRTEEMTVAVREKSQRSRTPGAESSSGRERCGHREQASDGLVGSRWAQGSRADLHAPEHSRRGFLVVNALQGGFFFFSFLPLSLTVLGKQPPRTTGLSPAQPFPTPLWHEAAARTALCRLLQQGSVYSSSGPLHDGEKNVVPGREACEHYSLLPTPASRGEPGVVSSQERQALEEGGFFFLTTGSPSSGFGGLGSPLTVSQRWGNAEGPVTGRAAEELV